MTDYRDFLIKDYEHWAIYVYQKQNYLGRCIVWCKREDALDITDATKEEQRELFVVLKELKNACEISFGSDWYNYSFLGNETPHLHCHFVPRYSKSINFMNVLFEDKLYGQNYLTDNNFKVTSEVLQEIKSQLIKAIN